MKNSKNYRPNKPKKPPEVVIPQCTKRVRKDGSEWYILDDFGEKCLTVLKVISNVIEPKYSERIGIRAKDVNNWNAFGRYYDHLAVIVSYLLELKGHYANRFEDLVADYLDSVYSRYAHYHRTPFVTQLGPWSGNNSIYFEEWIHKSAQNFDEQYWKVSSLTDEDLRTIEARVRRHDMKQFVDIECDQIEVIDTGLQQ